MYIHTLPELRTFLLDPLLNLGAKKKSRVVIVRQSQESLQVMSSWIASGQLRPVIDARYKLEDIAAAQQHCETGHTRGKVSVIIE